MVQRHGRGYQEENVSVADLVERAETTPLRRINRVTRYDTLVLPTKDERSPSPPRAVRGIRWEPHTAIQAAGLSCVVMACVFGVLVGNASQEIPGTPQALDRATGQPVTPPIPSSPAAPGEHTTSAITSSTTTTHPAPTKTTLPPDGSPVYARSSPSATSPRITADAPTGRAKLRQPSPTRDPEAAYESWESTVQRYRWWGQYWWPHH